MHLIEMLKKITSFRDLKKDWDSYGSDTIGEPTINLALDIAILLDNSKENWFVSQCANGEIQFESAKSVITVWRADDE